MKPPAPGAVSCSATADEVDNGRWPTLSVVMPSHNRRERLRAAVQALLQQDYPSGKVEIIVILDGCNDGSRDTLEELASGGTASIRVFEQEQGGPAAARNRGCAEAAGDLIVFVDDDVIATPRLLHEHARAHYSQDQLVTIGTMMPPDGYDRPVWVRWEERMLLRQYDAMLRGKYCATYRQFFTGNCALRRDDFMNSGGFDSKFHRAEDAEIAVRLHKMGLVFEFLPQAEAYHCANRSFDAWCRSHYSYGYADVVMERRCGHSGRLALVLREFEYRNRLIRAACKFLVNRPAPQSAATQGLITLAKICGRMHMLSIASMSLSCIANYRYWQGFSDALREVPVQETS